MNEQECRQCGCKLIIGDNWYESHVRKNSRICKSCDIENSGAWQKSHKDHSNEIVRTRSHLHGVMPMSENKKCTLYLGVHVAERVLSNVFKDVIVMPTHNPGFDFICNKGMRIDVKSSCTTKDGGWVFMINRNKTADHFLCIAFDNRGDLNPLNIWLLPSSEVSNNVSISVSKSTLCKWDKYALDIDTVVSQFNKMKGD